jgi:hypothetical protein
MTEQRTLTRAGLKTPRAAAIAGMPFSVLLIVVFWLLRSAVPADPREPGSWLDIGSGRIALDLNLVPFAGIAFLWFIGVLRDRLGAHEDRFFAMVFFGRGLLFLAMLFAALAGALITSFARGAGAIDQFVDVQFCARRRLQRHEHIRRQVGRGIHDNGIDDCNLYRLHAALAGDPRLCAGAGSSVRHGLGLCRFPAVGAAGQHLHFSGQHAHACKLDRQQPLAAARYYLALQFNEMPMSPGFPPDQSTIWNFIR